MPTFDPSFLDALLWLLITDLKFMREYGERIRADMFEDKIRFLIASYAKSFYEKSHCTAKQLITNYARDRLRQDHQDEATAKLVIQHLEKIAREQKQIALAYVTGRLDEFFKLTNISGIALVLQRALDSGDIAEAERIVQQGALSLNGSNGDGKMKPVDFFAGVERRALRRRAVNVQADGIHFMIPSLERRGVYAHRGGITNVIAPTKRGKSVFLTYAGKCAVFMGHNVLHVSLENPLQMVEDRYDAMFSALPVNELNDLANVLIATIHDARKLAKGRLHLLWRMAHTYSPYDLRADVEQLRSEGVRIDSVIVDYLELMKPIGKYTGDSKLRADRGDIAMNLRAVATDTDTTIITAQQTPVKKLSKFRLGMEDGQESGMPSQHASLVMTLNQTPDELKHNEMRLSVSGYWFGQSAGPDILVETDFDRMQFVVREMNLADGVEALKSRGSANP